MKEKSFKKHAIQLEKIIVNEASFKLVEFKGTPAIPNPKYFIGKSEYDKENHIVSIGLMAKIEGEQFGYICVVDIIGLFTIDESNFEVSKIDQWCDINAPYILHPYLRQHLFNLTLNATGEGFLLPLIEVPTSGKAILKSTEQQIIDK